jgi:hypothetical protein
VPKLSVYYLLLIVGFFIHYSYPFSSTFPSVSSTFQVLGDVKKIKRALSLF